MSMGAMRVFAVLLGGNPPGSGVEVHDVVFAVGETIEAVEAQLRAAWFAPGKPPHIDSWMALDVVDGARIVPTTEAPAVGAPDLWHVNLGYYESGRARFSEGHDNLFVIATSADEAKALAKQRAARASREHLHTDALHRVSERLAALGSPYRIRVERGTPSEIACGQEAAESPVAHDGYRPFD